MSYDVYLETEGDEVGDLDANYTYNLAYAIYHGGISMHGSKGFGEWTHPESAEDLFTLDGAPASAAATALADCIATIERDAEMLREREPDNGWGSVGGVCEFLRKVLAACREHPTATVRVS